MAVSPDDDRDRGTPDVDTRVVVDGTAEEAFSSAVRQIVDRLGRVGLKVELVPGGAIVEDEERFGTVEAWLPSSLLRASLSPVRWTGAPPVSFELSVIEEPQGGTVLRFRLFGWRALLHEVHADPVDWVG